MEYETHKKEDYLPKKFYEKPILIKEKTMKFPLEIMLTATGEKILCKQCSSCHGCR